MRARKVHHEEHVDEAWLLPYSDLMTLLLALFIIMFAMSQVDKEKLERMSEQFSVIFTGGTGVMKKESTTIVPQKTSTFEATPKSAPKPDSMKGLETSLEQKINESGLSGQVQVALNSEGLEISIQDVALFDSGKATVLDRVRPLLLEISKMLYTINSSVRIAGHTDNIPIHTAEFRSNWDLSAMRAINVMNYMVSDGGLQPEKLSIQAYGEYEPKFSNDTEDGRAGNRRIEIMVMRSGTLNSNIAANPKAAAE